MSRDDEAVGDSLSIQNQKMLLEGYAAQHGYTNLTHVTDDGWSGTRWDRPGIVKLIEEVERGNVELCLVKDMSRLGRDHLRVGLLLEQFRHRHSQKRGIYGMGKSSLTYLKDHLNGRTAIPEKEWRAERDKLLAERYAQCDEYYKLREDVRNVEVLRCGTEKMISETTPERTPTHKRDMSL